MQILKRTWFHIVIDVVHDLAAGIWPGAVLALWVARRGLERTLPPEDVAAVLTGWTPVFLIMLGALAVLVGTGLVRASYRALSASGDRMTARTRTVLVKHAVFVTVFVSAAVFAFRLLQREGG